MCVCVCDVIHQNGYHKKGVIRGSADVCNQMMPNLCLKDRTYGHTAVDLELRGSAQEVGNVNLTKVQTSVIDCKRKGIGRRVLSSHWKR